MTLAFILLAVATILLGAMLGASSKQPVGWVVVVLSLIALLLVAFARWGHVGS